MPEGQRGLDSRAEPDLRRRIAQQAARQDCGCLGSVDRVETVELDREPVGGVAEEFVFAVLDGGHKRVEHGDEGEQDGEHGGEGEQREEHAPGRAQQVAERHAGNGAAGQRQPPGQRGEPCAASGEVSRADGLDGGDAEGAVDRPEDGGDGDEKPDDGRSREDGGLEGRLEHGQRDERLHHGAHRGAHQQPHADAEDDAEHGDLRSEQQGADGDGEGPDAERHLDADLTPLRLRHAGGEVQRGERGAGEQYKREHVVELLVALRVAREGQVRRVILLARNAEPNAGVASLDRRGEGVLNGCEAHAGLDRQHKVVHSRPAGYLLRRLQRCEHDGKVRLRDEASLFDDEIVLRRDGMTHVPGRRPAAEGESAALREVVEHREVSLEHHDRLADLRLLDAAPCVGEHPVDARAAVGEVDADNPRGNEHRLAAGRRDVGLGLYDEALFGCGDAVDAARDFGEGALGQMPAAETRAKVVHLPQGEAGVVRVEPPLREAAQSGEQPRAYGDHERDGDDGRPVGLGVPQRPSQPEFQHGEVPSFVRPQLAPKLTVERQHSLSSFALGGPPLGIELPEPAGRWRSDGWRYRLAAAFTPWRGLARSGGQPAEGRYERH